MGSSPTPIIIGQYCSDFTIDQPLSGAGYYYYAAKDSNNDVYYLATSRVTHGDGTSTNQVDNAGATTVRIIKRTFVKPTAGSIDIDGFKEFRFKLNWYPQIKPDFSSSAIIPSNRRRYLNWEDATTPTATSTGLQPPVDTKVDRFVEISSDNGLTRDVKFSGTTLSTASVVTSLSSTLNASQIGNLRFFATIKSPTIQVRATQLKYLIVKSDLETLNTTGVTANKQLRYLIWRPVGDGGRFELLDLYDPDVSTTLIQRCAFRFSTQTNYDFAATNSVLSDDGENPPATNSIGGSPLTGGSATTTVGMDSYYDNGLGTISLTTTTSLTEPNSTSGNTKHTDYKTMFSTTANGFPLNAFRRRSDNTQTPTSEIESNGYQDSIVTISGLTYVDFATSGYSVGTGTPVAATETEFIITNYLVDKSIEEFFTDVNVTLLKVQKYRSPTPSASPSGIMGNNEFLGFDHVTPSNAPASVAVASSTDLGSQPVDLIVRDYYKFRDPARATQFKFYDLGKRTEYLWQVYWPSTATGGTFGYITSDGTKVSVVLSSSITSQAQRGWVMEYDTDMNPPGVRMRWTDTGSYLRLSAKGSETDSAPVRIQGTLGSKNDAAIFNCIMCSQIDSAGMCIPVSPAYPGGFGGGLRTLTQSAPVGSPVPTGSFRIRPIVGGSPSPAPTFYQYTSSQFGVSPSAFNVRPEVVYISSSPSPAPPGTKVVSMFVLTRQGTLSPASVSRNAVFIRSSTDSDLYLKYNTANNINRVELIASNNPSDEEGFAWRIIQGTGQQVRLYSVSTLNQSDNARYLQSNGTTIGTGGASFILDGITLGPNVFTTSPAP